MNPLTNTKNLQKLNQKEIELGLTGSSSSWHNAYKDSAWIFIGGLPYDLTEGDIIAVFSQYGEIVNINMVRDKVTGKQKGYAFICYEDQRSTTLAVDNLNAIKILNRTIRVDHVMNYKVPQIKEDVDELTKKIRLEGCGPEVRIEKLAKKLKKKEKKDGDKNEGKKENESKPEEREVGIKPELKVEKGVEPADSSHALRADRTARNNKDSNKNNDDISSCRPGDDNMSAQSSNRGQKREWDRRDGRNFEDSTNRSREGGDNLRWHDKDMRENGRKDCPKVETVESSSVRNSERHAREDMMMAEDGRQDREHVRERHPKKYRRQDDEDTSRRDVVESSNRNRNRSEEAEPRKRRPENDESLRRDEGRDGRCHSSSSSKNKSRRSDSDGERKRNSSRHHRTGDPDGGESPDSYKTYRRDREDRGRVGNHRRSRS